VQDTLTSNNNRIVKKRKRKKKKKKKKQEDTKHHEATFWVPEQKKIRGQPPVGKYIRMRETFEDTLGR
jgi:hypothetical protein